MTNTVFCLVTIRFVEYYIFVLAMVTMKEIEKLQLVSDYILYNVSLWMMYCYGLNILLTDYKQTYYINKFMVLV